MNERIKELAEQAGIEFDDSFSSEPETIYYLKLSDFEKFAELIVRKCLEEVRDEVQYEYDWKLADVVTERVLNYFGVKNERTYSRTC